MQRFRRVAVNTKRYRSSKRSARIAFEQSRMLTFVLALCYSKSKQCDSYFVMVPVVSSLQEQYFYGVMVFCLRSEASYLYSSYSVHLFCIESGIFDSKFLLSDVVRIYCHVIARITRRQIVWAVLLVPHLLKGMSFLCFMQQRADLLTFNNLAKICVNFYRKEDISEARSIVDNGVVASFLALQPLR
jgi:hypothetical protein